VPNLPIGALDPAQCFGKPEANRPDATPRVRRTDRAAERSRSIHDHRAQWTRPARRRGQATPSSPKHSRTVWPSRGRMRSSGDDSRAARAVVCVAGPSSAFRAPSKQLLNTPRRTISSVASSRRVGAAYGGIRALTSKTRRRRRPFDEWRWIGQNLRPRRAFLGRFSGRAATIQSRASAHAATMCSR
jgi:hypothetical protein